MAVNNIPGTDARESKGAIGVEAKRFLNYRIQPWKALNVLADDFLIRRESLADLVLQLLEFFWMRKKEMHKRGPQVGVRIQTTNDQMICLSDQELIRWDVVVRNHQREIIGMVQVVATLDAGPNDSVVLSQNCGHHKS